MRKQKHLTDQKNRVIKNYLRDKKNAKEVLENILNIKKNFKMNIFDDATEIEASVHAEYLLDIWDGLSNKKNGGGKIKCTT